MSQECYLPKAQRRHVCTVDCEATSSKHMGCHETSVHWQATLQTCWGYILSQDSQTIPAVSQAIPALGYSFPGHSSSRLQFPHTRHLIQLSPAGVTRTPQHKGPFLPVTRGSYSAGLSLCRPFTGHPPSCSGRPPTHSWAHN